MSVVKIHRNDKIIEEFADFVLKMIKEGADIDPKNEKKIIELFKLYVGKYCS